MTSLDLDFLKLPTLSAASKSVSLERAGCGQCGPQPPVLSCAVPSSSSHATLAHQQKQTSTKSARWKGRHALQLNKRNSPEPRMCRWQNLPGERSSKRPSFRPASFMQAPAEACTRVPYLLSSEYNSMPVHRISKVSANGLRGAKYDGMNHRKLFEGSLSASEALRVPP